MAGFFDSISNIGSNLFNNTSDFFSGFNGGQQGNVQSNSTQSGGIFNPGATASFNQQPNSFGGQLGQSVGNGFSSGLLFGQNGSQGLLNGAAGIFNDINRVNQGNRQIDIAQGQIERNNALEDKNRASAVSQQNNKFRQSAQASPFFNEMSAEEQQKFLKDNLVS